MRSVYLERGPYVVFSVPRSIKIGSSLVQAVGPAFNREVLSAPETWRTVSVAPGGPRNSAARRLQAGLIDMQGERHAHYRRMIVPPLRAGMGAASFADGMFGIAEREIDAWPVAQPFDLWAGARRLMRSLAIGQLFGNDTERGFPIADGISATTARVRTLKIAALRFDLPITPYGRMLRAARKLEQSILAWADTKRGKKDDANLLSVIVNSHDENGRPIDDSTIVGHIPTLFGASYETCQNALIWTLILLMQHPRVARDLLDEVKGLGGGSSASDRVGKLPLLDAVVRESMRIIPPVPIQFRVAIKDTSLGGYPVPKDARVVLSPFLTNRMPDLYPDPDRFRPERWASIKPTSFEYPVFSSGPRGCPGHSFGLNALKVALASILTRYRPALRPGARIDYRLRVALSPVPRVPVMLHPQDGAFAATAIRGGFTRLVRLPE